MKCVVGDIGQVLVRSMAYLVSHNKDSDEDEDDDNEQTRKSDDQRR